MTFLLRLCLTVDVSFLGYVCQLTFHFKVMSIRMKTVMSVFNLNSQIEIFAISFRKIVL